MRYDAVKEGITHNSPNGAGTWTACDGVRWSAATNTGDELHVPAEPRHYRGSSYGGRWKVKCGEEGCVIGAGYL